MGPLELKELHSPDISRQDGQPFSKTFQDIFFNPKAGLQESSHVFIAGNDLPSKWQTMANKADFCVVETGFGSGLNFLNTCLHWQHSVDKPAHLNFISTELFPMAITEMLLVHQQFPEVGYFSERLLKFYGSKRAGIHRYEIADDMTLTLLLGDVVASLKQLVAKVDAWFLDGFAPSRNPAMWRPELFQQMARLSKPKTTFATFSAAAVVKKGLTNAGFEVEKRPGFGRKRDMLVGHFEGNSSTYQVKQPWHPLPQQTHCEQTVTILGGGIAGLCLAKSFHRIGFQTTIIDSHSKPFQQASGNGYAMVMPMITAHKSPEALFYLRAFEFAQQVYGSTNYQPVGISEYISNDSDYKRAKSIEQLRLSEQLVTVKHEQIKYPNAGFVNAQALAADWQRYVDNWLQSDVAEIKRQGSYWHLFNQDGQLLHQCKTLIIASGMASQKLIQAQNLNLTPKLGQTHQIQTQHTISVKEVLLNQGYLIPVNDQSGHYLIGATFDHIREDDWFTADFSDIDHLSRNLEHWQNSHFYAALTEAKLLSSHTAVRATTPDHLPICGPVMDEQQFRLDYRDLHHGRHWQTYPEAAVLDNLYVLTGLGSRGFTSAPLLAELLMSVVAGHPLPLEADLCKIIHPNRFSYRQLKRRP